MPTRTSSSSRGSSRPRSPTARWRSASRAERAARISPLLSGRRDDEPHPGLHRRPRRRPGRDRARAAGMARRASRQPPRDHQPPRRRRRGRRGDPRAAGGPRPRARDRHAAPAHRVPRAQGRRRGEQGEGRRARDPRPAQRRDPRARELADVQPECAQRRRARPDAQSRADRRVRAGLDAEAVHDRGGARDGPRAAGHGDPDGAGNADDRARDDPRRARPRRAHGRAGDPEVVERRRREDRAFAAAGDDVAHAVRSGIRRGAEDRISRRSRRAAAAAEDRGDRSSRRRSPTATGSRSTWSSSRVRTRSSRPTAN